LDRRLCEPFGATPDEVKSFLADRGYAIHRWRDSTFSRVEPNERHGPEDLFAVKQLS
jgi:hypothetical protein